MEGTDENNMDLSAGVKNGVVGPTQMANSTTAGDIHPIQIPTQIPQFSNINSPSALNENRQDFVFGSQGDVNKLQFTFGSNTMDQNTAGQNLIMGTSINATSESNVQDTNDKPWCSDLYKYTGHLTSEVGETLNIERLHSLLFKMLLFALFSC